MKFGKYNLSEWEKISSTVWRSTDATLDSPVANVWIFIHKIYGRHTEEHYAWYPEFGGKLEFINEIYAYTTGFKEFKYNEENQAKKYVNEFLIRMDKLKVFT